MLTPIMNLCLLFRTRNNIQQKVIILTYSDEAGVKFKDEGKHLQ